MNNKLQINEKLGVNTGGNWKVGELGMEKKFSNKVMDHNTKI